jgi:hypothetical protein
MSLQWFAKLGLVSSKPITPRSNLLETAEYD